MKRLLLSLSALCALLLPACMQAGPNGVRGFFQDADEITYASKSDGTTLIAITGLSTSKPVTAAGAIATTISSHGMIAKIAKGWFGTKDTEVVQTNVTTRHAATQAANTRLAEIEATRAAEEAALEAAAPAAARP